MKALGQPGQYIKEKIPGSDDLSRTIYQFEKNSGLQFNNAEAKGFLNKSFTVEIYFKMDELDSWKRVLDFKNRKSDYGSYIYDGKLNFYDYAISEKAPVRANQYVHYVYSRDFETKMIKMYINGLSKVEFKDPGTEGMLDSRSGAQFFSGRPDRQSRIERRLHCSDPVVRPGNDAGFCPAKLPDNQQDVQGSRC